MFHRYALSLSFIALCYNTSALAQANANAVAGANDAFGYKNGDESVGIYDESSVRGFNLEAAGNYRVNGTYFVRNSGVSSFFLESSTVRIGYNTINSLLPGPSGVVDYRLRDPAKGERSLLTVGVDPYTQPYLDLNIRHRSADDRTSYSLGVGVVGNLSDPQGGRGGHSQLVAGTVRHNFGSLRTQAFFGEYQYNRRGQFRIVPQATSLPLVIKRRRYLGQDWSTEIGQRRIAGVLLDWNENQPFGIGATAVFSQEDPTRAFTQIFSNLASDGTAQARIIANPQQRSTSWSGELRGHYQWSNHNLEQRIDLGLRGRRSRALFGGSQIIDLGRTAFGQSPTARALPDLSTTEANLRDGVDQWGATLTYRLAWGNRLRLNGGILWTDYRKRFRPALGAPQTNVVSPLLYNLGLSSRADDAIEFYGSYSRGLEEAGVAPATANNRNEVLPAIIVTQRELGLIYTVSPGLRLVVGGFDTRKPYIGISSLTGNYGPLGSVRHRGVEFSLAGNAAPGLSVVVGGVILYPRISRQAVDANQIGPRSVAVTRFRAIANADWTVPGMRGLSVDAGLTVIGERPVRSAPLNVDRGQLATPSAVTFNLGARYRFKLGENDITARLQLPNAFNDFAWDVNSSETLGYSASRRVKFALTAAF